MPAAFLLQNLPACTFCPFLFCSVWACGSSTASSFRRTKPLRSAALLSNLSALHSFMQREGLRERHRALLKAHHDQFHPVWGQLMKTGYQNSRYAHQIER